METGPHDPHTVFGVFFLKKQNLERGKSYRLGRRAGCVCEAESEPESVVPGAKMIPESER